MGEWNDTIGTLDGRGRRCFGGDLVSQKRTVQASNDDLRRILILLSQLLTVGSGAATIVLALGWLVLGLIANAAVPAMLPVLTVASAAFWLAAITGHVQLVKIGVPYATDRPA